MSLPHKHYTSPRIPDFYYYLQKTDKGHTHAASTIKFTPPVIIHTPLTHTHTHRELFLKVI